MTSVTPGSGSGVSQSFAVVVADPTSVTNINWAEVLINTSLNGASACYLHYDRPSNTIYQRDDSAPLWVSSATLGPVRR